MDLIFLISLFACLVQLVRSGYWKRLPVFAIATVFSIVFEFLYQPYSPAWLRSWYATLVTPLLLARVASVAEAFFVSSVGLRQRRLVAMSAVFLALLFAAVIAWRFSSTDVLHSAIQARRVLVVGMAAFLGVYILLMWSVGYRRSGMLDFHVVLMFFLCLSMAAFAVLRMAYPVGIWALANDAAYAACSAVYLTWALAFWLPANPLFPRLHENHC